MMKESEKMMKGSVHKENFFIVHDSLVLMTSKEKITGMKENNYFHRWFMPMNGFQDGTPYYGRLVGPKTYICCCVSCYRKFIGTFITFLMNKMV